MPDKKKILIVDDVPENIQVLMESLKDEYSVIAATTGEKALKLSTVEPRPEIILLDVMMPGMNGYELCRRLKNDAVTADIPVMFITTLNEDMNEEQGLDLGAVDYITKPINPSIVKKRIRNQIELKQHRDHLELLVKERTAEIDETRLDIIRILGRAAEYKDNETGIHIIRMSRYCEKIALAHGLDNKDAELLLNAAPMHDVGKIGIPDNILQKPGRLDEKEREIINSHAYIGSKIIGKHKSEILSTAAVIAYEHHEKWDGSGYPRGLKGEEINIFSRITALADVFDALTSKRVYKEIWPVEDAVKLIKNEKGKHFDPEIVDAFLSILPEILKIREEHSDE
ncbi:MAG: two-component system response regulator [Spirochaetae bacterium HGW-Spirochaetae-5]|nr:MAG: two-component system response regulator [Spirochaetae bacterium HGW-Spirochaetae-5]